MLLLGRMFVMSEFGACKGVFMLYEIMHHSIIFGLGFCAGSIGFGVLVSKRVK